ncbi:hypothetical protein [Prescottella sp. R16]|uniref:hypothetical protein n=1 Tax=Prescottella sp. R16 TaxID=3064529 RepID=UPI00272E5CD5|nr:hypothetical protein [Prescottella sp. R16]
MRHHTDDAVAFAKQWESKNYMKTRSLDLSSVPDLSCALALTVIGLVCRTRPSIPVRIVRARPGNDGRPTLE